MVICVPLDYESVLEQHLLNVPRAGILSLDESGDFHSTDRASPLRGLPAVLQGHLGGTANLSVGPASETISIH